MYCTKCGKGNPAGAVYCAFCGQKLFTPAVEERSEPVSAEAKEVPEAHRPYMRPETAQPIPSVEPEGIKPASSETRTAVQNAKRSFEEKPVHKTPDETGTMAAPQTRRTVRAGDVDAAGRIVPERRKPIAPERTVAHRPSTIIPEKKDKPADDLFFEEVDPGDDFYEEDDDRVMRGVKSAIAGAFLLAVLAIIFWVLVMPGGKMLRAKLGVAAPADAYALLAQEYTEQGSVKRAADAWYNALRLDPENYEYALRVAQSQELAGDMERALTAYAKCMTLDPAKPEPYLAVANLYEQMGDSARVKNALKTGYDRTGDVELFRKLESLPK